jgi:2-polyprenyl-6-methoxyphenol hydroxylase-like FAD-dependent oxidoreductase
VIVAGGGPVGLFLAAELRRNGCSVAVVERLDAPSTQIKAGSVGSSSAEIFDQRGLLDRFPQPDFGIFATAAGAASAPVGHFAGLWVLRGAPEIRTMPIFAAQHQVEVALETHARQLGVTILREHEIVDLASAVDGVRVRIEHGGEAIQLTADYVVGCDGGRSIVRKLAGFDFPGTDATITGRQALVDIAEPNPLAKGWHRTDRGMVVFGPGPQRVLTVEFDGPPANRTTPVDAAEIEASLRRVSGTDVTVTALHTATRWTDNTRQVTDYRRDRVLLAGDAAHVHPPFGGQGLNLGFQDAVNLGWKLAATIAGWAPADLLDTYTSERHPVAAGALENTRAQIALMRPDAQTGALRSLFTDLMAYDDANAHVTRLMSGVDRPYPVDSDHAEAGRIAIDRPIADSRLYEILRAPGGVLVDASTDGRWTRCATAWIKRVRTVTAAPGTDSLLIRPDGVVAWAADADGRSDEDGLSAALDRWFGKVNA